jgi:glycosyltransferase involved in cell wall biosynthesis
VNRVSVTIIAWNEEERLKACLESVAWADEIIVVDAESTDKTVQVAREFTDKIWVRRGPASPRRRISPWTRRRVSGSCPSTPTSG